EAERAAREIFAEPIGESYTIVECRGALQCAPAPAGTLVLTVLRRPGVMDPVLASAEKALRDAGIPGPLRLRTARRYRLAGAPALAERGTIERRVLSNPVIEEVQEGDCPLAEIPALRAGLASDPLALPRESHALRAWPA